MREGASGGRLREKGGSLALGFLFAKRKSKWAVEEPDLEVMAMTIGGKSGGGDDDRRQETKAAATTKGGRQRQRRRRRRSRRA